MLARSERRFSPGMAANLATVLVLFLCCAPAAHALFPHHDATHKEIEDLEMQWRQAVLTNDVPALSKMLADDYLGISPNGTLETKGDVLAARRAGHTEISELNLSDIKIRVYGNTAVVTSRAELVGHSGDRDVSGLFRYTRVYTNRNGQWKIVSFEASRVRQSRAARR
jgi:ketosteroid isomerase-like protein